tara:strand:- start:6314 stop:8485 length:2172 start_codon:yes stop_codon:yes gene_type:complete
MIKPTIIISAYNREAPLIRLLDSIKRAAFEETDITLVISIDKSDNENIPNIAEKFNWVHGKKKIIIHKKKLGLKKHILYCLKKVEKFKSIILLEDDLIVSKYFYNYSMQSLRYYADDNTIAGISLYNYNYTEVLKNGGIYPFNAINDDADIYFMKVPSSWGLTINKDMWLQFDNWYQNNLKINEKSEIPNYIKAWSHTSWKKHLFHYMISENKYFIYPRVSYTSNFNDEGTSDTIVDQIFQVPLALTNKILNFKKITEEPVVYDEYFEITAKTLNYYLPKLKKYEYQVDLYGIKDLDIIDEKYLLTSRSTKKPIITWGKGMQPHVLNIINEISGNSFSLSLKTNVKLGTSPPHHFHYNETSIANCIFENIWVPPFKLPLIPMELPPIPIKKKAFFPMERPSTPIEEFPPEPIEELYSDLIEDLPPELIEELYPELIEDLPPDLIASLPKKPINLPSITIIAPIIQDDTVSIKDIIKEFNKQDFARKELLLMNTLDFKLTDIITSHDDIIIIDCPNISTMYEIIDCGINKAQGEYIGVLTQNGKYNADTLKNVAYILKNLPVSWIYGLPKDKNGYFVGFESNHEIINQLYSGKYSNRDLFDTVMYFENIFWEKWLWIETKKSKKLDGNFNLINCWYSFIETVDLYHVERSFGQSNNKTIYPKDNYKFNNSKIKKSLIMQIISKCFYPFFKLNIPILKSIYIDLNEYPLIIKNNKNEDTFFFSRT